MHCFYLCLQVIQNRGVNKTYNHTVVAQLDAKMYFKEVAKLDWLLMRKKTLLIYMQHVSVVEVASFVTLN